MPRQMAVFCDETGTHDCDYFGWGSIWCPRSRIVQMDQIIDEICRSCGERRELKWNYGGKGNSRKRIISWFFATPWICFQSLLVRKDTMRIFDEGSRQVAFRKLLCTLLTTQMSRFDALPGGPREFTIYVDRTGSTTRSLTAREFRILTAASRKKTKRRRDMVRSFQRIDSRSGRGIQLADLFIGALRARWEGQPKGKKGKNCRLIARELGWKDLRGTTSPNLKFNVWLHHDSRDASPHIEARRLHLERPGGDPKRLFDAVSAAP